MNVRIFPIYPAPPNGHRSLTNKKEFFTSQQCTIAALRKLVLSKVNFTEKKEKQVPLDKGKLTVEEITL